MAAWFAWLTCIDWREVGRAAGYAGWQIGDAIAGVFLLRVLFGMYAGATGARR